MMKTSGKVHVLGRGNDDDFAQAVTHLFNTVSKASTNIMFPIVDELFASSRMDDGFKAPEEDLLRYSDRIFHLPKLRRIGENVCNKRRVLLTQLHARSRETDQMGSVVRRP